MGNGFPSGDTPIFSIDSISGAFPLEDVGIVSPGMFGKPVNVLANFRNVISTTIVSGKYRSQGRKCFRGSERCMGTCLRICKRRTRYSVIPITFRGLFGSISFSTAGSLKILPCRKYTSGYPPPRFFFLRREWYFRIYSPRQYGHGDCFTPGCWNDRCAHVVQFASKYQCDLQPLPPWRKDFSVRR